MLSIKATFPYSKIPYFGISPQIIGDFVSHSTSSILGSPSWSPLTKQGEDGRGKHNHWNELVRINIFIFATKYDFLTCLEGSGLKFIFHGNVHLLIFRRSFKNCSAVPKESPKTKKSSANYLLCIWFQILW